VIEGPQCRSTWTGSSDPERWALSPSSREQGPMRQI